MLKNLSSLKAEIAGKEYLVLCDMDSPLDHVEEFGFLIQKYVREVKAKVKDQQPEVPLEEQVNVVEECVKCDELLTP